MAVELATAYISLVPSAKGIGGAIDREMGGPLNAAAAKHGESAGKSFGGKFSGALKGLGKAAALGVAGAALAIGGMVAAGAKDLVEIERLNAQTSSVIKSTGGAAGVATKDVRGYAESLEKMTGIEAEGIQEGENLLLTFTNIKNGVGKGNDVFNQATSIMTDMSVALGTDAKGSAIQLGKALNDPIKGVTALQKVGVSFTQQQKDQIKSLQESGDTMGAQKIILGELNKEFGGSAKAFGDTTAGKVAKLKNQFGDLQEGMAMKLIPVALKAAEVIQRNLPAAIAWLKGAWVSLQPTITTVVTYLKTNLPPVIATVVAAFQRVVAWVQVNWPKISVIINQALSTVRTVIQGAVTLILAIWNTFGNNILTYLKRAWGPIQLIVKGALNIIQGVIRTVTALIKGDWGKVWDGIKQIVQGAWQIIQGVVRQAVNLVMLIVTSAFEILRGAVQRIWSGIKQAIGNAIGGIKSLASAGFNAVKGMITRPLDQAKATASTIIDGIKRLFSGLPDTLGRALGGLASVVGAPFRAMGQAIKDAWNSTVGGKGFTIPDVPGVPGRGTRVEIPRLHTGGPVTGPTGSEQLRILEAGEWVLSRAQVASISRGTTGAADAAPSSTRGGVEFTGPVYMSDDLDVDRLARKLDFSLEMAG